MKRTALPLIGRLALPRILISYVSVPVILFGISLREVNAYEAPFYCSYVPSHQSIICDVNVEGLSVTDVVLNDGKCISPASRLKTSGPQLGKPDSEGSYRIPLGGDFRRTYEEGDSFLVPVDPQCDLITYTVKANDKTYRFDYKPIFPF